MVSEDIILPAIILPFEVFKAHFAEFQIQQEIVLREFSPDGGVADW
ncbi:hypothetical protein [Prosthecobacter sp.]|jgi:hypothetical protein